MSKPTSLKLCTIAGTRSAGCLLRNRLRVLELAEASCKRVCSQHPELQGVSEPCLHATRTFKRWHTNAQAYQGYIRTVLTRVNTINGRRYSEDPTVFSWELANEPASTLDTTGQAVLCCPSSALLGCMCYIGPYLPTLSISCVASVKLHHVT